MKIEFTPAVRRKTRARVALCGPSGSGKAQPVDAPVLTPSGWRPIGDLRIGDAVFAADGTTTAVAGVYPQGVQPIYRLTFTDGATAESTSDHLWATQTILDRGATTKVAGKKVPAPRAPSPKPLREITATLIDRNGKRNHWLPMAAPVDFPEDESAMPLDPWLLGVLLGDGCLRGKGVSISKPGSELRRLVAERLPAGARITIDDDLTFRIIGTEHGRNPVLNALRDLGLHGLLSVDKHVPQSYLFASAKTRAAVLAGLLDTDGHAKGHTCEFGTSSPQLAEDARFLVESLGGTAAAGISRPSGYVGKDGQRHECSQAWRLHICPPAGVNPFEVRAGEFTPRTKYPARRAIESVEYSRDAEAVCIAITHPSRLYVTSRFAVTHNTYTALAFAHVFAPGSVALIDTEKESADGYEGLNGWHWVSFKPATYEPDVLIDALAAAAAAGIGCVVIDSLSHFWMGTGGMLEQVDNSAKRSRSGNSFAGWKEMRPAERRMIEAMTSYPGHLIVTMRTKTEWVIQDNERGKKEPRRIGTKPEQREGIEYEFSVVADMDLDNVLTVTKTRVPPLKRAVVTEPGPDVAQVILDWLSDGGDAAPDVNAYRDRAVARNATREDLLALLAEVEDARVNLAGATVVDDEGETVTLKDLIIRKGREASGLSPAPAPEPPAQREEQRSGPRRADRSAGTPADDSFYVRPVPDAFNWATDDDVEAVSGFMAKLADTSTPAAVRLRRRDLELAKAGLQVTPETFAELDEAISRREAEIKAEAA